MSRHQANRIDFPTFHSAQRRLYDGRTGLDVWRCGRRFGKALALDTPLPTPSGWTTMGDVREGDTLFDEAGKQCRVTAVTEIMHNRPCNVVVFSDGTEIVADDEHQWLTWDRYARKNRARNSTKVHKVPNPRKAVNQSPRVRTTAEIASSLGIGPRNDTNHSIPNCAPIACDEIDLPIPPYVLGAWLGDGLSQGARLVCNDPQIVDEIISEGQPCHKAAQPFMYALCLPGKKGKKRGVGLQSELRKLGLIRNKHIPPVYLRASVQQRLELAQGLMDTDGTAAVVGNCEFTTIKSTLAEGVLELMLSLGIRATMSVGRAKLNGRDCGPKYRINFTTSLPVFRLQRKLDRLNARKSDRNINHRFIVDVRPCESVPVRCIQVDSPNSLYLASEAFIPTHNTTLLEIIAGDESLKKKKIGWFLPNYKLVRPTYKRLHQTLRARVEHSSKVDGIIEMMGGGEHEFWTLGDEDAGRSRFYDLVIIDEAGLVKKGLREIWEQAIAPTLLDRGGKAIMAGTPKGISPDSFFYTASTDPTLGWTPQHMPTSANPKLDPVRVAELIDKYPPLVYQQEYLAEFVDWSGAAFFALPTLLVDGKGVDYPAKCDYVFATIDTAVKTGKEHDSTAVTFWAGNKYVGVPLTILDWDIIQLEGDSLNIWLPSVFEQLEHFAKVTGARNGSLGAWIEDKVSGTILLQHARKKGWRAHAIDSALTAVGKEERALSASPYVHQGKVKLSAHAYDKRKRHKQQELNHLVSQVCGFRMGSDEKNAADDLLDTFCYGVAIGLGNGDGY